MNLEAIALYRHALAQKCEIDAARLSELVFVLEARHGPRYSRRRPQPPELDLKRTVERLAARPAISQNAAQRIHAAPSLRAELSNAPLDPIELCQVAPPGAVYRYGKVLNVHDPREIHERSRCLRDR